MLAMLPIIRRCSPSEEPNRALGARTQCRRAAQLLHRVLFSSRLAEELRGEVTNKSVPLNQERCVCACVCTPLISQSVHVFIPYCPPPFKTGDCLQSLYVLESYPPLPASFSPLTPPQQQLAGSHGAIQLPLPSCCASAGHLSGMDTGAG